MKSKTCETCKHRFVVTCDKYPPIDKKGNILPVQVANIGNDGKYTYKTACDCHDEK